VIDGGEAQAAGLHDQAGHAGPRRTGGEGGVEAESGYGHAKAVWADEPHAVPPAHREQFGAGGGLQPGGDDHQGPHAALAALLRRRQDRRGGHRDHRQVRRLGQVGHRGQARLAADLSGVRVDRVEVAGVPAGPDVLQDRPARCARPPARADHRD
jgi:hypothetical protein